METFIIRISQLIVESGWVKVEASTRKEALRIAHGWCEEEKLPYDDVSWYGNARNDDRPWVDEHDCDKEEGGGSGLR